MPSVFTFRPVPKCRRKPTVHIDEVTSNSPLYGPPTYQTWLEEELHITKDLLGKELSKVLELKTQVSSYRTHIKFHGVQIFVVFVAYLFPTKINPPQLIFLPIYDHIIL